MGTGLNLGGLGRLFGSGSGMGASLPKLGPRVPMKPVQTPFEAMIPPAMPEMGQYGRTTSDQLPGDARVMPQNGPFVGTTSDDVMPDARAVDTKVKMAGPAQWREAIGRIESGGKYNRIGPTHRRLGRALGKYQVMEANIGPWSKEVLGRALSADEFLADTNAQDRIFDSKFGSYAKKYGPSGAAQAWFAGEGGVGKNRKDSLGTSTGKYAKMFEAELRKGGLGGQGDFPGSSKTVPSPIMIAGLSRSATPPGTQTLPVEEQRRGGGGGGPQLSASEGSGMEAPPRTAAGLAAQDWKVNKTTRRLRGLSPGATIGVLTAIGQYVRQSNKERT